MQDLQWSSTWICCKNSACTPSSRSKNDWTCPGGPGSP